ncbi:hypothetical protein I2485_07205 [Nesterenkonia sp. E16_7]|uniref:hypothetical protein n=1 Tax=unclassified Nesterenkonia TaxID=2629769 RepID=UPI001A912FC4|nr:MULTISPECIES: hypothetical protein [unclassified Nesterenkonia]MBO0594352.1 hypothetical protein [Nesterenkonia sp. E16_10]MBO0598438.1 hypothetical protein [Nesterenkonia sp. E16_7]
MDPTETRDQEIARLSEEVARLRSRLETQQVQPPPTRTRRAARGRAFLATLLILLGVVMAPLAVVAAWTKAEVNDTDQFVATMAPIIEDPAFQAFLVEEITAAINEEIDIETVTSDLFDGIATLDLPPRASDALQLLEQPAVEGAQSQIRSTTERLIASDTFEQVWDQALRISHARLIAALSGDTSGAVVISESGEVGIQLGPLVASVKEQLTAQGFALAERIPEVDRTLVVAQSDELVQARTAYQAVDVLGFVLPWVGIGLITLGVLVAGRRARALIWAGVGLAFAMALLAIGVALGRVLAVAAVSPQYLPPEAAEAIYDALVPLLYSTALALGTAGVTLAALSYFAGPFRGAVAVRRLTVDSAEHLRAAAENAGVTTGRFGAFLHRARRSIRIGITVIGAAVVLLLRPLTPEVILWTVCGALLAIVLLELLQRPPSVEAEPAQPRAPAAAHGESGAAR